MIHAQSSSVLDSVEHQIARFTADSDYGLEVSTEEGRPQRLTLAEVRTALHRSRKDQRAQERIWRPAISATQIEGDSRHQSQLALVWLAAPYLRGTVRKTAQLLHADRLDVESEMVTTLLETACTTDAACDNPGGTVLRAAVNSGWTLAAKGCREHGCADIAGIADRRNTVEPVAADPASEQNWELEVEGPYRLDGLAAIIRFTTSRSRIEGYRLGAMAGRLGLREVVQRGRRPSEGEPIGAMRLVPSRAAR